jgi:hypothetical protein
MPYQAKGVPDRFVSVGPATTAKASSEGWRLCLHPNTQSINNGSSVAPIDLEEGAATNNGARDVPILGNADGYVGTLFLHQHCACQIINLIVKCGLKRLQPYLDSFRTAIVFLNASIQRIAAFKCYSVAMNVHPSKFGIDMVVRWNSTYLMLKHLVPYKKTFGVFMDTNYPRKPSEPNLLTNLHWYMAKKLLEFLELFYDATMSISSVYSPTSHLKCITSLTLSNI